MSNKTSDKNVANVTKSDIDILKALINVYEAGLPNCDELLDSEVKALKKVLAEREQDKARIKELEEELEKATRQLDLDYVEENFTTKQQVKGKLKELKIERDKIYKEFIESNRLDKQLHVQGIYLDAQIIILQELLEGEK